MTNAATLVVEVGAKDIGVSAFLKELEATLKRAEASASRAGSGVASGMAQGAAGMDGLSTRARTAAQSIDGLTKNELKAATTAERLAAAQNRTASTSSQAATAAQRLATETNRTAAAAAAAAAANDRAAVAAMRRAQAEERAATASQRSAAFAGQVGDAFGAQLAGMIGPAAIAAVGVAAVQGAGDLATMGAQAELVRQRFDQLAAASGTTGTAMLAALRAASGGEINDLNLQLAANRAQLLGVADSAEEFSVLMAIARDRAQSMGVSTSQAFNDLVTGLGRGSALILDNLGIMVSIEEVNQQYAESVGKTVAALTEQEQKQALINAVIAQGQQTLNATGGAMDSTAGKIQQFNAALDNLKAKFGGALAEGAAPVVSLLSSLSNATDGSRESLLAYVDAANEYTGANAGVAEVNRQAAEAILNFLGIQSAATAATQQGTQALAGSSGAWMTEEEAARAASQAVTDAAAQELTAAVDAQTLTDAKQRLAEQALNAAQAVIDGGGSIEATAARLAASSSQVDILTAAYLRLLAAQQAAGIAGAQRLAAQAKNTTNVAIAPGELIGGPATRGTGDVDGAIKAMKEYEASQKAAADATRDQQFALANQAGQVGILRGELAKLTPGTAEYIRTQTELLQLQNRKPAGGGGGKTAKLTAAEKEQQQLLKGQEDYQNKSIDAAREYEEALGEIAEEGAKARAEAQDKYEIGRKRGAVGFYQGLAGMEDQDIAQQLSARYETAALEAQEIARTKGADAAQAYLDAQRDAITAQGELQAEIAQAEEDKDAGKAEYLRGLLTLQQDADAEELRQVQAQGSEIAAAEAQQYAEAELRYAQHLNEMGLIYERKFGQAAPGMAPPAPGIPAPALAAPATAPAAAPSTTAAGTSLVSDPATQAAIDAGLARVEGKLGEVAAAVGAVERRVGDVEGAVRGLGRRSALAGG